MTPDQNQLKSQACLGSAEYRMVSTKSAAVSSLPSDHMIPGLRVKVQLSLSADCSQLVAAPGWIL